MIGKRIGYRTVVVTGLLVGLATVSAPAQTIIVDPMPMPPERRIHPPRPMPRPPMPPRPMPPRRNVPLVIKKHTVVTNINQGVAVTKIDQVFVNTLDRRIEGTYIFPLDDDVALGDFSMFVNGVEIKGKLLPVEQARREYEAIVAKMRDPALLEYIGTKLFRARIFPIEPKAEVRIKLAYTQMLASDDGLVRYRYPLNTEKFMSAPAELVSVLVNIESSAPIKNVFSPSHRIAVSRNGDHKASASFEGKNVYPDRDFELFYTLSEKEFGLMVLTYRESGEEGFFLVRIAPPGRTLTADVIAKDITLVIDTSGSMRGEKMRQAREALKFCLSSLNPIDRFNIVPFSHEAIMFRPALVAATPDNVAEGLTFVDKLRGYGGTNINDALLAALKAAPDADASRPYLIVFLTDGQPTLGETNPEAILSNVQAASTGRIRLFAFGLGNDVNTTLLDLLAEQNRGTRDYVAEHEDLELKLSSFYRKIADPVLADLALSFGGLGVHDMYPPKLTDLFSGTELVITGRYSGDGPKAIKLAGMRRGTKEQFTYETTFPSDDRTSEFLPRLWATRKIGYLLDEIRLHGEKPELKDTIVQLATRYGIVTPYTAMLVTEPGSIAGRGVPNVMRQALDADSAYEPLRRASRGWNRRAKGGGSPSAAGPGPKAKRTSPANGARAQLQRSKSAKSMRDAESSPSFSLVVPGARAGEREGKDRVRFVTRVGTRTFYHVGDRWVDSAVDAEAKTVKVELFSAEYFALIRKHKELAKCFALGERVVVALGDKTYETVPPADSVEPIGDPTNKPGEESPAPDPARP